MRILSLRWAAKELSRRPPPPNPRSGMVCGHEPVESQRRQHDDMREAVQLWRHWSSPEVQSMSCRTGAKHNMPSTLRSTTASMLHLQVTTSACGLNRKRGDNKKEHHVAPNGHFPIEEKDVGPEWQGVAQQSMLTSTCPMRHRRNFASQPRKMALSSSRRVPPLHKALPETATPVATLRTEGGHAPECLSRS